MDSGKTDELQRIVKTIIDAETTILLEHADNLYIVSIGRMAIREETTRRILSARKVRRANSLYDKGNFWQPSCVN